MIKKTFLIFCMILLGAVTFATDPNCPRCGGSGLHQEGGTSISHVNVSCRNCGDIYDAFYIHQCECQYCANYVPQSSNPDASWDDDIGYQAAKEYARQKYSPDVENRTSTATEKSFKKIKFKTLPAQKTKDSDSSIPSWLYIVRGIAIAIFLKWFFDD